jgi:NAD(P)H-flavin reductase
MTATALPAGTAANPWQSHTAVIRELVSEAAGVTTYQLSFADGTAAAAYRFQPGQFSMLYLPGTGEVPIGISGSSAENRTWWHTVRLAGNTTRALGKLGRGDTLGLRGPFGSWWPLDRCEGRDVVLVAGGMGLPPLRPAIEELLAHRERYGQLTLIYGARTPDTLIYAREYKDWSFRGLDVQTTVDQAHLGWRGNVGVVPRLFDRLRSLVPERTIVMACGPEVMMRFTVRSALARGLSIEQVWISLERNMQCAVGLCGHCQLGPEFICKDGPVFRYDRVERWVGVEAF